VSSAGCWATHHTLDNDVEHTLAGGGDGPLHKISCDPGHQPGAKGGGELVEPRNEMVKADSTRLDSTHYM
jgi:hypothetical protein